MSELKLRKALEELCFEFRWVWDTDFNSSREVSKEQLWFYLENFDFEEAFKDTGWGFRWYQYAESSLIPLWKDMSYEEKLLVFISGHNAAESAESSACQSAGEDW